MKKLIFIICAILVLAPAAGAVEQAPGRDYNGVTIFDARNAGARMIMNGDTPRSIDMYGAGSVTSSRQPIIELPAEILPDTAAALPEKVETVRNALAGMVLASELSEDEIVLILAVYEPYEVGKSYQQDNLFRYENQLYKVNQSHTSQADRTPDNTPALYSNAAPAGVIPEWVQPTGAHDAYQTGNQVQFEGSVYESLIDANVWSPTAYPEGWDLIE